MASPHNYTHSFIDLRSPLLDVDDDNAKRDDDPSPPWRSHRRLCSKVAATNPTIDTTLYEIVIRCQLCKMHVAWIVLELGSEATTSETNDPRKCRSSSVDIFIHHRRPSTSVINRYHHHHHHRPLPSSSYEQRGQQGSITI